MDTEKQQRGGDRGIPSFKLSSFVETYIDWKVRNYKKAKNAMQDTIIIELRVDFQDKEKIPELIKVACAAARHMVANVMLLGPTHKPDCVVITDNFMTAPGKINIYSDLIAKGHDELQAIAAAGVTGVATEAVTETEVSSEMLDAMKI